MKKKDLKELNEIIKDLTKLETELSRRSYSQLIVRKDTILEWFGEVNDITSRLDNLYKREIGIK